MNIGIMQPYIFPYMGYFQLINSVDKFVIYDDVAFIKQGWINRNKILLNDKEFLFTIPIANVSSFVTIAQTQINLKLYDFWKNKFYRTIAQGYKKAPHFSTVMDLIVSVLDECPVSINELAIKSLLGVSKYLEIKTIFELSATTYSNDHLKAQDRVIDICKKEKANGYINSIGGHFLYSKKLFEENGINLKFIKSRNHTYPQFSDNFIFDLSIIDVLMFNTPYEIAVLLDQYELI